MRFLIIVLLNIATIFILNKNINAAISSESVVATVPAIEQPGRYIHLLKRKRVGLIANHTSLIGGIRSIDALRSNGVNIVKVFSPEHGFAGAISAATNVPNVKDAASGISVVSLFGDQYKPTVQDLNNIDVMLFDMQDVGVRFYTYISTLHYIMQACAENDIPLIVTDRPNPNDGYIDGPVRAHGYESFISIHPIPIVHGVTIGEYAKMINGEGWLKTKKPCRLTVIPMYSYYHGKPYRYTIPPSPNLNALNAIFLYPSLCWFGATAISDGRGTLFPFQAVGAPLFKELYPFSFRPKPIKGMNENPKYNGDICYGIDFSNNLVSGSSLGGRLDIGLLLRMYRQYPDKEHFFNGLTETTRDSILHFDLLAGSSRLREQIVRGESEEQIRKSWEKGLKQYKRMRKKYLLYPDIKTPLKIMTYNIRHGTDAGDRNHLEQIAVWLKCADMDFVGLQEVDSVCERSGKINQAEYLAAKTGMFYTFVRHFDFQGGAYGIALLSRYPLQNIKTYNLPVDTSSATRSVGFFTADAKVPRKGAVRLAVVHMDYRSQASRINQAHIIGKILSQSRVPTVLMGDMNSSPGKEEIAVLMKKLKDGSICDCFTFPSDRPDRKIDYIMVSNHFQPVKSVSASSEFSDHLPLTTIVEWK